MCLWFLQTNLEDSRGQSSSMTYLLFISVMHLSRERNDMADKLSKDGIEQAVGSWRIREETNGESYVSDQPPYAQNL